MKYQFVGLIKRNTETSRVLVMSETLMYFVWETSTEKADSFSRIVNNRLWIDGIDSEKLSLASPRQIEVGRGIIWKPNQSNVMVQVVYYGVVSGGKSRKTILVMPSDNVFKIVTTSSEDTEGLEQGDLLMVDSRRLKSARDDHIKAGSGIGKLKRKKRVSV